MAYKVAVHKWNVDNWRPLLDIQEWDSLTRAHKMIQMDRMNKLMAPSLNWTSIRASNLDTSKTLMNKENIEANCRANCILRDNSMLCSLKNHSIDQKLCHLWQSLSLQSLFVKYLLLIFPFNNFCNELISESIYIIRKNNRKKIFFMYRLINNILLNYFFKEQQMIINYKIKHWERLVISVRKKNL